MRRDGMPAGTFKAPPGDVTLPGQAIAVRQACKPDF
jgi:hypothetical protein